MHSAGEDLGSGKLTAELLGLEEVRIGDDREYRSGPDNRLMESLGQDQDRGLCGDLETRPVSSRLSGRSSPPKTGASK